ncbi:hypothetical protein ACHMW6_00135 (plasmid) [Pseudoduganella sp. UC29_106]|uniref:hypothetical protein n=1 Tax=Pseudoduganella sp. UC29_106 TaxID=3374553 RepID=UPI003756EF2C
MMIVLKNICVLVAALIAFPVAHANGEEARSIPKVRIAARQPLDPLRLRVVMQFPPNVTTVQQAAQYLLETAQYKLVLSPANPNDTRRILTRPLLGQDKDGSLQTIEDALLIVGGDDTVLVIDRENRMITFEFIGNQ